MSLLSFALHHQASFLDKTCYGGGKGGQYSHYDKTQFYTSPSSFLFKRSLLGLFSVVFILKKGMHTVNHPF